MKEIIIYEPAMCCSTGLCGVSINPELLRISAVVNDCHNKGFNVIRYNLSANPGAFVQNVEVNRYLMGMGTDILPITLLNGKIVKTKSYPSNAEFEAMLGIKLNIQNNIQKGCNCSGGCC